MNAVIYARYSSHSQTEQSIEGQLRVCCEYAQREGFSVVGEYIDRAVTGKTDGRPQFQKMIEDAKKHEFDYVIVYKLDRFARNRYDSAIYKHKLKQHNVKVLSAMENIGDGPEWIILEAVLEASAEYYSHDLAQKVTRGMKENLAKGISVGGVPPIGYKSIDKKIVIDQEKASIIKYAFERYANGDSKRDIVDELTGKGVRNAKGKPLTLTSFQDALKNKKYIGIMEYAGQEYTDIYPALIDIDVFNKVQAKLKQRAHSPALGTGKVEYLLAGKVFCGKCGTNMFAENGRSHSGDKHYYYACRKKKAYKACDKKNEKKDFLEWYVVEQTVEYVLTPERMEFIAERVVAEYDKEFNNNNIKELERRLVSVDRDIDKSFNMMFESESAEIRKRIEEKVKSLEQQKQDIAIDLAKLRITQNIRYTKQDILAWLKIFCNGDLMDMDFRKRIIDVFINSVYVYDDKLVIYYNIKDGKQVSYIESCETLENSDLSRGDNVRNCVAPLNQKKSRNFNGFGILLFCAFVS